MPIQSFKDKVTVAVFDGQEVRKLPREIQPLAKTKLNLIDAARLIEDLRIPPGNMLEKLIGKRKGQWSIRIKVRLRPVHMYYSIERGHPWCFFKGARDGDETRAGILARAR